MILLTSGTFKKMIQMSLFTKQKQTHKLREQTYDKYRGMIRGRIDWEFGTDMYSLLYLKYITHKDLYYTA